MMRPFPRPAPDDPRSRPEETPANVASGIIHGIAALLSVLGLTVLIVLASRHGTAWHVVSVSIYGATLFLLFLASTLYHSLKTTRARHVFRILDHSAIFLLIAGTYTPFMLVPLRGGWGWSLFGVVWGLAAAGIVFKSFFAGRFRVFSTGFYMLMGCLILVGLKPLLAALPLKAVLLLAAGGVLYAGGTVFYHRRDFYYHHAVWHLCVVAGSLCHYLTVLWFILPS